LKILTVNGSGIEKLENTLAEVRLGVKIQEKEVFKIHQEIAKKSSAIISLLKSKNVDQLQTTGVRLETYYRSKKEPIDYIGNTTISFYTPIDNVGILLDEAIKVGANSIDVSFTATPEAISSGKKEAIRKATIDAQANAKVVLNTLKLTSKEIINIEVDRATVSQALGYRTMVKAASSLTENSVMPMVGGEQIVQASITLQISY
jgi:uncharacterized protein